VAQGEQGEGLAYMSKDYHEQTDQFQMELANLIDKYTIGDADSPDAEVLNSPLEPRLNFQTIIGCLQCEAQNLIMTNAVNEAIEFDELDEGDDTLSLP
jgi:hypothetical protein